MAFTSTLTASVRAEPLQRWLARYTAEAGCPGEREFREALESRLGRSPEDALGQVRLTVALSRAPGAQAWRGQLDVTDTAHLTTTREVEDASCEAVVHALTLVAALSGTAQGDEQAEPDPSESGPPSLTEPGVADPEDTLRAPAPTRSDAPRAAVGGVVLAVMQSALAPRASMGVGLGVAFEWARGEAISPWFQLAITRLEAPLERLDEGDVTTRFEAVLLTSTACPMTLRARGGWWLRPCLDLDIGRLTAAGAGRAVADAAERNALWLSTGLSLHAGVLAWGPLELSAALGASAPLARHEFFFSPDIEVFRVPGLSFRGTTALALMF